MRRVSQPDVDKLRTAARRDVEEGKTPACQLALAVDGELIVSETFGHAGDATRFAMMSCTKALVSAAVLTLISERALDVELPVIEVVPEFGANGKDAVTIEQLLLHTAGFPRAPMGPDDWFDRGRRLEKMASWRLQWAPGTRCCYHPTSAHWVLAEVIERVAGADYREVIHSRVTEPLGLPRMVGIPKDEQRDIADIVVTTAADSDAASTVELPPEINPKTLLRYNSERVREVGVPAAGGYGTASDLAQLYQALIGDNAQLWDPQALKDIKTNVRCTLHDDALGTPGNRTLGFMVAGDRAGAVLRGFGRSTSPMAFGHPGAGGQIGWGDPDTGLSFCYLTAGIGTDFAVQLRRTGAFSDLAVACLRRRE